MSWSWIAGFGQEHRRNDFRQAAIGARPRRRQNPSAPPGGLASLFRLCSL